MQELKVSENYYQVLFEGNPQPMWIYDLETLAFLAVNDAAIQQYGYSRQEFLSMTIKDIRPPEDIPVLLANIAQVSDGLDMAGVWRHLKKDGSIIQVEIVSHPLDFSGRHAELAVAHDITGRIQTEQELRRVNRALRTFSECSQSLINNTNVLNLLNDICRIIVEQGGYILAWIGLVEQDEDKTIRPIAIAGSEAGYLEAIQTTWADTRFGLGPISSAIRSGNPVIVQDLTTEFFFEPWREEAVQRGYASLIALPLISDSQTFGTLIIYSSEPNVFGQEETKLLTKLADQLSFGIVSLRARTAAEQTRAALHQSEERYRLLAEAAHDMIFIINREGNIEYANSFAARSLGYRPEDLIGKSANTFFLPETIEHQQSNLHKVLETEQPVYVESRTQFPIGELWLGTWLVPFRDEAGRARAVIGIARDITERKQSEETLRQSEELFRSAFDNAPIGIALVSLDNRILQVNRVLCEILGFSRQELLSTSVEAITHPGDRKKEAEFKANAIAGDNPILQIEKRYLHADGHIVWGQLNITLISDSHGQPLYFLEQIEDITRRKMATGALRDSEQRYRTLFTSAQRQAQELSLLDKARTALAGEMELSILFKTVVEAIKDTFGYTLVSLYLRQSDYLIHQHQVGYENIFQRIPIDKGIMGRVARTGQPVLVKDVRDDPDFMGAVEGISSEVCVPLFDQGQVVGVLNVESTLGMTLTEADLRLMTALSEHIGVAIERARLFTSIRESEERYARAAQGANDGLWDWDLKKGTVYYSTRWKSMLGYHEAEISDSIDEWFNRIHPDDIEHVKLDLTAHLESVSQNFENEHRVMGREWTYRWVLSRGVAVRDTDGVAYRIAGSMTDITQRKRAEEQMLYDAFHDALTGLPNRALFLDRLDHVIQNLSRNPDHHFSVIFLDLDHFKVVNDSLGHSAGDQLLISIANRLKACMRPADTFARLGGDEFVVLLENIQDIKEATQVAERIQMQLAIPFKVNDRNVFTSASMGIVWSTVGYQHSEEVLRDVDIAMYRAKAQGKACYQVFDIRMRENVVTRLELEADLRQALERQELVVHYQPIVSLENKSLAGFEALVRWKSPIKGLIYPKEFIQVAEESLLIVPIDRWVLRESCGLMVQLSVHLPKEVFLTLDVNLSSKQFTHHDLTQFIQETLLQTGLNEQNLRIEITESVIMEDIEYAIGILEKLHKSGIQICIDDFGTGYSSLSYLFRLPVNALKIDRSFISRLDNGESAEIVHTIIDLAHNLGVDVIAEGVETDTQWKILKQLGCDYCQGYLISHPMDGSEVEKFIQVYQNGTA